MALRVNGVSDVMDSTRESKQREISIWFRHGLLEEHSEAYIISRFRVYPLLRYFF